jgi:hypothetical protein
VSFVVVVVFVFVFVFFFFFFVLLLLLFFFELCFGVTVVWQVIRGWSGCGLTTFRANYFPTGPRTLSRPCKKTVRVVFYADASVTSGLNWGVWFRQVLPHCTVCRLSTALCRLHWCLHTTMVGASCSLATRVLHPSANSFHSYFFISIAPLAD